MEDEAMIFYSRLFPNLTVILGDVSIKFKDGEYRTDDTKECKLLKEAGFDYSMELKDTEIVKIEPVVEQVKEAFKVPKRWTLEKILEFAVENKIDLPENVSKSDAIEIVEKAMAK